MSQNSTLPGPQAARASNSPKEYLLLARFAVMSSNCVTKGGPAAGATAREDREPWRIGSRPCETNEQLPTHTLPGLFLERRHERPDADWLVRAVRRAARLPGRVRQHVRLPPTLRGAAVPQRIEQDSLRRPDRLQAPCEDSERRCQTPRRGPKAAKLARTRQRGQNRAYGS